MQVISVDADVVARILEQLKSENRPGRPDGFRNAHSDVLRDGWGMRHDLQDILWETDGRADTLSRYNDDFDCLLEPYQLHWISRYRRPPTSGKEAWGGPSMRAEDIAVWIMEIERLGFTVDPVPLVEALRPRIMRQFVTNSELAIMWYKRERHKNEPLLLKSEKSPDRADSFRTDTEYLVTTLWRESDPVAIRVDAPKSRSKLDLKYWTPVQMRAGVTVRG